MHYSGSRRVTTSRSYALSPQQLALQRLRNTSCNDRARGCFAKGSIVRFSRNRNPSPIPFATLAVVSFFGRPSRKFERSRGTLCGNRKFRRSHRRARAKSAFSRLSVASSTLARSAIVGLCAIDILYFEEIQDFNYRVEIDEFEIDQSVYCKRSRCRRYWWFMISLSPSYCYTTQIIYGNKFF